MLKRRNRLVFVILLACIGVFCAPQLLQGRSDQETNSGILFRVVAPKSTVCVGSSLELELELRNASKEPLRMLPDGVGSVHFRTTRTAPDHTLPEFAYLERRFDPLPYEKPVSPIVLQPGESYRYVTSLGLKDEFFKSEGFYKLRLDYDGGLHQSTTPKAGATDFKGNAESNWLIFEIEDCS